MTLACASSNLASPTNNESIRTNGIDKKNQSVKWLIFFVLEKNHPKRKGGVKMQIIKEKIEFEKSLKQRFFICEFSNVTPIFINGSIRKIDKTNLSYIELHRVIVKGITFLFFNYSNDIYISNLTNKM